MILSTYFQYQQKMPADLNVEPLFDLARKTRGDHPFRASNALLLATILNPKASWITTAVRSRTGDHFGTGSALNDMEDDYAHRDDSALAESALFVLRTRREGRFRLLGE